MTRTEEYGKTKTPLDQIIVSLKLVNTESQLEKNHSGVAGWSSWGTALGSKKRGEQMELCTRSWGSGVIYRAQR